MKFGVFYEHELPRPWTAGSEARLYQEALDEIELADRLGYDYVWEVEHHFLEEYSHSSAPEVFLAAASQRTKNIRLGHGIKLLPPAYNAPARVAEAVATLDLVSGGRVDFGTGESASRMELEGFGIDPDDRRGMWTESIEQIANMLAMEPYPGFKGKFFSMPMRNVVPKPVQKPHPPLWVACSNRDTIRLAARLGIGALTFAFIDPAEAREWVDEYYSIIKSEECKPIGHAVNANIAIVTSFSCHRDADEAVRRGADNFKFFRFALGHYYGWGTHRPGQTDVWAQYERVRDVLPDDLSSGLGGIGSPEQLREHFGVLRDTGIDQAVLVQQCGKVPHEHICESLELFAHEVMHELKADHDERERRKSEELTPYIEAAMARKEWTAPAAEDEIVPVPSYGHNILIGGTDRSAIERRESMRRMQDAIEQFESARA